MRSYWCKQLMWKNVQGRTENEEKKIWEECVAAGSLRFNYISFAFRVSLVWARSSSSSSSSTFATLTFNGNHLITFTSDMEHWIWKSGKTRPNWETERVKNSEVEGVAATRREIPFYIILLNFTSTVVAVAAIVGVCVAGAGCVFVVVFASFMIYENRMHEMRKQQQEQIASEGEKLFWHNPRFLSHSMAYWSREVFF